MWWNASSWPVHPCCQLPLVVWSEQEPGLALCYCNEALLQFDMWQLCFLFELSVPHQNSWEFSLLLIQSCSFSLKCFIGEFAGFKVLTAWKNKLWCKCQLIGVGVFIGSLKTKSNYFVNMPVNAFFVVGDLGTDGHWR